MASRNHTEGTQIASTFGKSYVIRKKRGRPPIKSTWTGARTPFEALRYELRLERKEWGERIGYSIYALSLIESGKAICTVPLAKRMIEEARRNGIAVTLDELYQHVLPAGMEAEYLSSLSIMPYSEVENEEYQESDH